VSGSNSAWAEPGTFEVAPGVYRIPLPLVNDGLRAVNVYALIDGDDLVVIDAGWATPESRSCLNEGLTRLGLAVSDISQFLITHSHSDHYTQAISIRSEFGTPVSLGEGERRTLEWITPERMTRPFAQIPMLLRAGAQDVVDELMRQPEYHGDADLWGLPDRWLSGTETIELKTRTLRAIHTPGHTRGHYVFWDSDANLLFAGDHVLPQITPSIGFEAAQDTSPLRSYLASLLLVRTLPDATLLPAHGPVTGSVHSRVDELLDHHGARLEKTLAAVALGASSAREVAGQVGWTRHERHFDEMDVFNQMLATLETAAHLHVLVERGLLSADEVEGIVRYDVT
jgi:glyoxylase-like metal-dependent hydrolase (beta-lactamase superfamily II)